MNDFLESSLKLGSLHVVPRIFNSRNFSAIQGLYISLCELNQHGSVDNLPLEELGLDLLEDFSSQDVDLLHEFLS